VKQGKQLVFDLGHREAFERENFFVSSPNSDAVAWIDRWPEWPDKSLAVYGPKSCGKTHLAHVFQKFSDAQFINKVSARELNIIAGDGALIIDNAENMNEKPLLHLLNLHRERGGSIMLTSKLAPAHWEVAVPDLSSRLSALTAVEIGRPDDALMSTILIKHFSDRQLLVVPEVVTYLVRRLERSFVAAVEVVRAIDDLSLTEGRVPSIPMAREVLGDSINLTKDEEAGP
jgi:chromosomal replication initiation ATPase DnaA